MGIIIFIRDSTSVPVAPLLATVRHGSNLLVTTQGSKSIHCAMAAAAQRQAAERYKSFLEAFERASSQDSDMEPMWDTSPMLAGIYWEHLCRWLPAAKAASSPNAPSTPTANLIAYESLTPRSPVSDLRKYVRQNNLRVPLYP